jgi:hypothetical protein
MKKVSIMAVAAFCLLLPVSIAAQEIYSKATLPAPGTPGKIVTLTDDIRGPWVDTGSAWIPLTSKVNVRWFGATGNGVTDDSAAIQAALNAAADFTNASSTLYFPAGKYRIAQPVSKDFSTSRSQLIVEGDGSSSKLLLNVSSTATALTFINGYDVLLRNLIFVGPDDRANLGRGISFINVLMASVEHCSFFGLHSTVMSWGGVIHAQGSRLFVRNSSFRACSGNHVLNTGNITVQDWKEFHGENLEFIDFGVLDGVYHTIIASPDGWIRLGNVYTPINSYTGGFATMRNIVSDEGAASQLKAYTDNGNQIQSILVDNWRANNGVTKGFWFHNVKNAVISHSQVAYQPSAVQDGFEAVLATNVNLLVVERSQFLYNSNAITLGAGTLAARIVDSTYGHLNNPGGAKITIDNAGQEVQSANPSTFLLAAQQPALSTAGSGVFYLDNATGRLMGSFLGSSFFPLHGGAFTNSLVDNFSVASIDPLKWVYTQTGTGSVSGAQSNGLLNFTARNNCTSCDDSAYYESANSYDFTMSGSVSVQAILNLKATPNHPAFWSQGLEVWQGTKLLYMMRFDNRSSLLIVDEAGTTYAVNDNYWRIRYEAGFVKFETAPDGLNWTVRKSSQSVVTPNKVKIRLRVRAGYTQVVTGQAQFDNFKFTQFLLPVLNDNGSVVKANGDIEFTDSTKGFILKAPNGKRYRVTVDDTGQLKTTLLP